MTRRAISAYEKGRCTHQSLLPKFWVSDFKKLGIKMHVHNKHGTQQYLRKGWWWQRQKEVSGYLPPRVSRFWTIIRYLVWLEKSSLMGTDNYPNTKTSTYDILFHYKKAVPQRQSHTRSGQWHFPSVKIHTSARQSQETMWEHLRVSRTTTSRKWDTMR